MVETRVVLRDDTFEAELADRGEESAAIVERLCGRPPDSVESQLPELAPALVIRTTG